MKKILAILIFTIFFQSVFAQNIAKLKEDYTKKLNTFDTSLFVDANNLIKYYKYRYPDSAIIYAQTKLTIASRVSSPYRIIESLLQIAELKEIKQEYSEAISYYLNALRYLNDYPDDEILRQTLIKTSCVMISGRFDNFLTANEYLNQALIISDETNFSIIYSCKAYLFEIYEKGQDSADLAIEKALQYIPYNNNDELKAKAFYLIAQTYSHRKEFIKAVTYLKKSINISKDLNLKGKYFLSLGEIYIEIDQLIAAKNLFSEAEKIFTVEYDNTQLCKVYIDFSKLFLKQNDYDNAIKYAQRSLKLAKYLDILPYQEQIYFNLADIYSQNNNIDLALYSYKKYSEIKDKIFSRRTKNATDLMFNNYIMQLKLKDRQLLLKQKEYQELKNQQQRLIIAILAVSGFLLLIILLIVYYLYSIKKINEARLRQITEVSQEGIIIHDGENIIDVNDRYCQISQFERDELIGKSIFSLMPKDSQEIVKQRQNLNRIVFYKMKMLRKDLSTFEAEILSKPFVLKNKKVKVVSIRDLSEIKEIKDALHETREKFKALVETSPDGVVIMDKNGKIEYSSPAFVKLFGYEKEENITGKDICNFFDEIYKNKIKIDLKNIIENQFNGVSEYIAKTATGKTIFVESNGAVIKNKDGQIESIFMIMRDVTEKKLVENALIESESRFKGLFNNSNDAIILQNEEYEIIDANPSASKLLGYDYKQLVKSDFRLILPVEYHKIDYSYFIKKNLPLETYVISKSGKKIYIQILFSTLPFKQKQYFQLTIRDITTLKEQEQQLISTIKQLTATNKTKDKLFSIIAHDLRGPIGTWKTMIEFITSNPEEFKQDELINFIETLKESSEKTYDLLDNLLNWAKAQQNIIEYNPAVFNIADLIRQVTENIGIIAGSKNITINENIFDAEILADENMMRIVLRNILNNAIKFTPEGGKIFINLEQTDKETIIKIKDTGIGITQENIKKILDEQTYFTTYGTNREKGSGLGLKICMDFVKRNNGEIKIKSEPGKGSEFSIILKKKI